MEQQKMINMVIINDNKNNMNDNKSAEDGFLGVPIIHSQVMKIKQEIEKIKHPSLQQQEMRRVLLRAHALPQRSRSPLGLVDQRERSISVHN
ncbi:hypothetical protein L484_004442 [Morus notabilis]|uniref:Uncharacterized protein n=1 Tax=Morus notabilis TaxID=981085 RepID=W9RXG0_9ROSA|nr:uncharacterized protein LOC21387944 [Morus notabilis]EXC16431.1 hypothetical protein L484_004442 [Morus notabilis]